jgi:AAA family ATP:ADP antiporter
MKSLLTLQRGEGRAALLAALGFFCALYGYSILRPIRDAAGLQGGTNDLPWLFTATLAATLIVSLLVAELSRHIDRRKYVIAVLSLVVAGLVVFAPLLRDESAIHAARAFYIWVSVINLLIVSTWFSFLADMFTKEQALRLYGLVGVGGTSGAFLGAMTTGWLQEHIGVHNLLLVAGAFFAAAIPCAWGMPSPVRATATQIEPAGGLSPAWRGLVLVPQRPVLLGICLYTFFHTFGGTFLYFLQAEIVAEHAADRTARTAIFATIDAWTQGVTLVLQVFLTARWTRWVGTTGALLAQPFAVAVAGACVWWALSQDSTAMYAGLALPVVAMIIAQVAVRAVHFASARPVREALYVPLPSEEKYKAKAAIDTFVYRAGDALGARLFDGYLKAAFGLSGVALWLVPLGVAWCGVAAWLGKSASSTSDSAQRPDHPQH